MKRLVYRIVAGFLLLFSALVFSGTLGGLRPGTITTAQACLAVLAFFAILGAIGLVAQSFQSDKSLAVAITGPEGHALIDLAK